MSKRINLDNLKTFLTQLKTHITDPIANDVSTLSVKVRNAENNIITANSNISSVQQALNDKASNTHNHDSVYVKQDGSTPITNPLQLKQGSYVHEAVGGGKSGNWILISEINIKSYNINQPLEFNIVGRNRQTSITLWILFEAINGTDPVLVSFKYNNATGYHAYLVKKATSTWSLYINKAEPYDFLDIINVHIPKYTDIVVTYKSTTVSTLQEGGTYASPVQYNINNKCAYQVNAKNYISNPELLTYVNSDNTQIQFKKSGLYKITVTKANNQTSGISFCDTSLDFETKGNVLVGYNVGLYEPVSSSLVMYIDKTKTYEFFGFALSDYHGATEYVKYRGTDFKTNLQGSNILIELIKEC